jgi:hypothetical protein
MPFVQFIYCRSCALAAALAVALVAAATPRAAYADALDAQPQAQEQSADANPAASDETSTTETVALDDRVLANQRGTGLGLMTVAASAQTLATTSSVTLWDEIAPPSPAPVPVDTSHVAQSNAVSYFRK